MIEHAASATPPGFAMHGPFSDAMALAGARIAAVETALSAMLADAAEAPGRLPQAAALLTDNGALGPVGRVLGAGAGALLLAGLLALLAGRLLGGLRVRLADARPTTPGATAILALRAFLLDLVAPFLFLGVALALDRLLFAGGGLAFTGSASFGMVMSAVIVNITVAWIAFLALAFPLGAGRRGLRLLPMEDAAAAQARRFLRRVIALGTASWLLAESLFLVWIGDGVPRLILILAAVAIAILCLRQLARWRRGLSRLERIWHHLAVISVFGLTLTWTLGLLLDNAPPFGRVLGTLAILLALALADGAVRLLLARVKRSLARATTPPRRIYVPDADSGDGALHPVEKPLAGAALEAATIELDRSLDALVAVLHDAAATALAILAGMLLARTWSLRLVDLLGPSAERSLLGMIVDAGLTLLVGWYAWRLFETGLAVHLSREEGGAQSRARTVQPLLRGVGRLVIGALALMGGLTALGVSIAPLLASAGVVGIAVGFGAQTLVKDLFSGACYLIEDVFRIGDYIEAGSAKGTVEKITFRTVALRHQNGPLHYVPYGSLGSVRNNSRDWVIDKFEIPLAIGVSSERVRRIVKEIGRQMLEDPELGPLIMMPLKAKLYRIQPGAKIFRCKVQTPPGRQFEIRAEAYRRIEAALAEAGIGFAEAVPQVTVNAAALRASEEAAPRAAE
ncbi:MAG: mechanosensitive ion channel family protein [Alphaproteobacteria bacterium]|nr:mechanosensitive ion channel family protein [Alphaproteobacteria bacterium]